MSDSGSKIIKIVMAVLFLLAMAMLGKELADVVSAKKAATAKEENTPGNIVTEEDGKQEEKKEEYEGRLKGLYFIVDPGHGGDDPGKVGITGVLEKDVNLAISGMLKKRLENAGAGVLLTRENDHGLYDEGSRNKKVQDLKRRIAMIEKEKPDYVISIHQNSYPDAAIKGAQCFYYTSGQEAGSLATSIQDALRKGLDESNQREAKTNDNYFLLKKTPVPTVIVECGFLSNQSESELLSTNEYREKVVDCIMNGIVTYIESKDNEIKGF